MSQPGSVFVPREVSLRRVVTCISGPTLLARLPCCLLFVEVGMGYGGALIGTVTGQGNFIAH